MWAAAYRQQRERLSALPARHEDAGAVLAKLADLSHEFPGVAALENGRLCGYLIGFPIPEFKGAERGLYCPIWAHAAARHRRASVYRQLYERISSQWVQAGCLTHAITLYADDAETADVWFRNGFGLLVIDALRPLSPVESMSPPEVTIRQGTGDDLDSVLPLSDGLSRYMADGPIFLPLLEMPSRAEWEEWLTQPAHTLWLALRGGEAVAYLRTQPPAFDATYVVSDPQTISITGAYAKPEWRSKGVATLLLQQAIEWARANGYERCSVDFESANLYGSRFWLRHFRPICHSLIRRVDERIAWAHAERPAGSIW